MNTHEESSRILVYLAHPDVLRLTAFRLRLLGFDAIDVATDQQMSDAISEALPDLVIVDLDLEEGAGSKWIERLASDECTNHIPIMCVSKEGDLQDAETAFKAGAREFLLIPYDPVQLEDKVDHLLYQSQLKLQERSAQPVAAATN